MKFRHFLIFVGMVAMLFGLLLAPLGVGLGLGLVGAGMAAFIAGVILTPPYDVGPGYSHDE